MRSSSLVKDELSAVKAREVELEHELRETQEIERSSIEVGEVNRCGGRWQRRGHLFGHDMRVCSYCGGIHPEDFVFLMSRPGVHYSGSDWKYGWPHKFYVYMVGGLMLKFYAQHLNDAGLEVFDQVTRLSRRYFDVEYCRIDGKLGWAASYLNIQLNGETAELPADFFTQPFQSYFEMKEPSRG